MGPHCIRLQGFGLKVCNCAVDYLLGPNTYKQQQQKHGLLWGFPAEETFKTIHNTFKLSAYLPFTSDRRTVVVRESNHTHKKRPACFSVHSVDL